MGLLTFVGRIILVVMNIVFILLSLAMVAGGFILRYGHDLLRDNLKSVLDEIKAKTDQIYSVDLDTDTLDFGELVTTLAIVLIVVGLFLLAMSFVGCCGACCNFSTIMLVYAIVLIVLLVAQVVVVILIFATPDVLKKYAKEGLVDSLDEYEGLKGTKLTSMGWNWAMQEFDCCGPSNYEDFQGKGTWQAEDTTDATKPVITPVACCKELPSDQAGIGQCAGDTSLTAHDTIDKIAPKSNYDKGCLDAIWYEVVEKNTPYFLTVVGICFACQLVIIVFAVLIFKDRGVSGGLV